MTRLEQLEADILKRKHTLDAALSDVARSDHAYRLLLWREFLHSVAPLLAERERLITPLFIPRDAAQFRMIPTTQMIVQKRRQDREREHA